MRITLTGTVTVETSVGRLDERALGGPQARLLFVLLASEPGRALPRGVIADVLWPEGLPTSWETSLRALLSKLRAVLAGVGPPGPPAVTSAFGCYQLHLPAGTTVDVQDAANAITDAERCLAHGDSAAAAAAAAAACDVVARPFLPGVEGEWVSGRRAELRGMLLQALDLLADAWTRAGRPARAVTAATGALALEPFRDAAQLRLMAAHVAAGSRSEALHSYDVFRRRIADELGVEPSAETQALYLELLREDDESTAPSPAALSRTSDRVPAAVLRSVRETFVGRDSELGTLAAAVDAAGRGRRQLAFVSGEPGIGKTALVAVAAARAAPQGAVVLYGRCDEEATLPYQPFVDALGELRNMLGRDAFDDVVAPHAAELAMLSPLVAQTPSRPAKSSPEDDQQTRRYLMFAAVADVLARLAGDGPVVLILDDLHWADRPTLQLLRHLIARGEPKALLVAVTYNDAEVGAPLAAVLAAVSRERDHTRLALGGLDSDAVETLVRQVAEPLGTDGGDLVAALMTASAGNPFLIHVLARHLVETGALEDPSGVARQLRDGTLPLPASIHAVVTDRLERLGARTRRVLQTAAVIGHDFDIPLLAAATGQPIDMLVAQLERAERAGLVEELAHQPGQLAFTHAVMAHAIGQGLQPSRRRLLHLQVAGALEQLYGARTGERIGDLAFHAVAAATLIDQRKTLAYTLAAGQRALDRLAPEDAVRWFSHALDALARIDDPPVGVRGRLLVGLGLAQRQSGRSDYRQTLLDVAGEAAAAGDKDTLVGAALALHRGEWSAGGEVDHAVIAVIEDALDAVGQADSAYRPRLLGMLAGELTFAGDWPRRRALADDALAIARRLDDRETLAFVLQARLRALEVPETLRQRERESGELVELAATLGDPTAEFFAAWFRADICIQGADTAQADPHLSLMHNLAERLGQPFMVWADALMACSRALISGDLDHAEDRAQQALEVGSEAGLADAHSVHGGQLMVIRTMQGRAADLLPGVEVFLSAYPHIPGFRVAAASVHALVGNHDGAAELLQKDATDGFASFTLDPVWLLSINGYGEVCAEVGAVDVAPVLYDLLLPWRDQVPHLASPNVLVADVLGRLALLLGRHDDAEAHLALAQTIAERCRSPYWAARALLGQADLASATGRSSSARTFRRRAVALADEHGFGHVTARAVKPSGATSPA